MTYAYGVTNQITAAGAGLYNRISGVNTAIAQASYLKDSWLGKRAAVGSLANNDSIVIDMGAATALTGIALLNHNLVTAGGAATTVTVKGADDSAMSTNLVTIKAATTLASSAPAPKKKDHLLQFPATFTHAAVYPRYYQLLVAGMTGTTAVLMGELFATTGLTSFTRGSVYGSSSGLDVVNAQAQMQYGEPRSIYLGGPIREETYKFADWSATQVAEMSALYEAASGFSTPFLWAESVNPTATAATAAEQACIFGNGMLDRLDWTQDDYNVYQLPALKIRSLGREAGA